MGADGWGDTLDDRVSPDQQISLTRHPGMAHELVTGPFPHARNEQDAWIACAREVLRQHRRETSPGLIYARLAALARECDGDVVLSCEDMALVIDAADIDETLRLALRGGDICFESE